MMKLLSYHIENYGKIHNQDGDFSDAITCICEKNGFGKSTLASFIKAMFYGLDSYTVASKGFNDRQHFYPFEGGKFGGNLTFESDGKIYRIERFFDKKSGRGDECKVYLGGAPFDGFGEEIGKTLFGLDEESFLRTVFITANEIEVSSTHSINEKLNQAVEGVGEDDGFERAIDALDKAKKSLKAARGNNDKISEKKREIGEWNAQIKNLRDMSDGLATEYVERERLHAEIGEVEKELKDAGERNLTLQKWDTYDAMQSEKARKEWTFKGLKEKYPSGLPNEKERAELQEALQKSQLLHGSLQAVVFSLEKEKTLQALEGKFENGIPMDEVIAENQEKIQQISALQRERERLVDYTPSEREKTLKKKFSFGIPQEDEWKEKRALVEEYKKKDGEWKALSTSLLQEKTEAARSRANAKPYFFLLATVLLGVGLGVLFVLQALGITLMILGGVCFAIGTVMLAVNKPLPPSNVSLEGATLQAELKLLEEKLRAFTVPYGYYSEAGVLYDVSVLEEDVKAHQAFLRAETERTAELESLTKTANALESEVARFLQSYGEDTVALQLALNRLSASLASYRALKTEKQGIERRLQELSESLKTEQSRILNLIEKYKLDISVGTMDGLKGLEVDAKAAFDLAHEIEVLNQNLIEYKERNRLTERPDEQGADTESLHARLFELRKKLANCDKRIAETERFVEKLPDAENALLLAEEKLKEYKEKYDLLADTIEALKGAEQSLKDKYVAPIKERFSVYANVLEQVLDEKISMDKDFRIVFERGGEARSDKHLSAGERSLCALCLRLALIDNMYETQRPFIVMDDPFVHLDETHMERTKALMNKLAKDRQIIYFCCHESRKI